MKDAGNGGGTGMRTSQCLDHLTHFRRTHSLHKHFLNGAIQFVSTTMIALEQLCLIALSCSWHRQIRYLPDGRFQTACVVSIALIATLLVAFVGLRSNEDAHFFLQ